MQGVVMWMIGTAAPQRRMTGWFSAAALLVLAVATFGNAANAQLNIEITSYAVRPVPIAVVPFGWQGAGAVPFDLVSVITADLESSGRFAPIPVTDMVSRPTQPAQVNFQDWRVLDVDALVIGQMTEDSPGRYTIVFQLFDPLKGEQLLGFRLTAGRADLRATAHRIADMVFEKLTGIPGVFGTQIAYVSEERRADNTKRFRLIVADADGENPRIIADSPQPLMSPAWAPDSRRLAYVSFEGDQSAVYVQTLRTGTRDRVSARAGVNSSPIFSPDGRQLALTLSREGNLDIYTLDLATQTLRQLTNDAAIDTEAVWAPDGQTIYFTSDRAGGPQIYRVSTAAGARAERVTFEGTYSARARVSPDGKQLAVVYLDRNAYRIAVVDPASGITQVLSNGQLDESPSFAPNGAQIIYATRKAGRGVLAAVSTDGRIRQEIASVAGDVREPVWSPYPRP